MKAENKPAFRYWEAGFGMSKFFGQKTAHIQKSDFMSGKQKRSKRSEVEHEAEVALISLLSVTGVIFKNDVTYL